MTSEELFAFWAPADSVWSPWVLPVPFAQLICPEALPPTEAQEFNLDWLPEGRATDSAIVADLPGGDTIYYGLALLDRGYRPVPIIDGSPGPELTFLFRSNPAPPTNEARTSISVVDMRGLLRALCQGAARPRDVNLAPSAPPAFLLDSNRMTAASPVFDGRFDNRWMAFPQDFPSSRFLREHGIRRVIFVHDKSLTQPAEDLAHVLLRWQEDGITVESKAAHTNEPPVPIRVSRPSRFRAVWYRALAALGLRRSDAGGFGGYPVNISGGG